MRFNRYPMKVAEFVKCFYKREIVKNPALYEDAISSTYQHLAELGASYVLTNQSSVKRPLKYDGRFVYAVGDVVA